MFLIGGRGITQEVKSKGLMMRGADGGGITQEGNKRVNAQGIETRG